MLSRTDLYGNTKSSFHVTDPHTALVVRAVSVVEVVPPVLPAEALRRALGGRAPGVAAPRSRTPGRPTDFTFASPYVDVPPVVEAYARASFPPRPPRWARRHRLMHRVHDDFAYRPRSTTIGETGRGPAGRAARRLPGLRPRHVAALRSLGLPARYVSGYLANGPPPGKPRLVGADASHAWVGVWVPGAGWLDLDPTNNRLTDARHVTVGWGRDYGDVRPSAA